MVATLLGSCGLLTSCGDSSSTPEHCATTYVTLNGPLEPCDSSPETYAVRNHCNICSGEHSCVGALNGSASCSDGTDTSFGQGYSICAPPCSSDADCAGLDFAAAGSCTVTDTSQTWSCQQISGGSTSYCVVQLKSTRVPPNPCQQCIKSCQGVQGCCSGCGCICQSVCGGAC